MGSTAELGKIIVFGIMIKTFLTPNENYPANCVAYKIAKDKDKSPDKDNPIFVFVKDR